MAFLGGLAQPVQPEPPLLHLKGSAACRHQCRQHMASNPCRRGTGRRCRHGARHPAQAAHSPQCRSGTITAPHARTDARTDGRTDAHAQPRMRTHVRASVRAVRHSRPPARVHSFSPLASGTCVRTQRRALTPASTTPRPSSSLSAAASCRGGEGGAYAEHSTAPDVATQRVRVGGSAAQRHRHSRRSERGGLARRKEAER